MRGGGEERRGGMRGWESKNDGGKTKRAEGLHLLSCEKREMATGSARERGKEEERKQDKK